jgi:Domain of Unknown Function (DUF1259)
MRIKLALGVSILAASLANISNSEAADWTIFSEPFITSAHAQAIDWQKIDETLGRKPAVAGDVHWYGFPRSDLTVTLDGVTIKPALALGGWIAFKPAHGGVMAMGDLVLLETEVTPVVTKLTEGGLEPRFITIPPASTREGARRLKGRKPSIKGAKIKQMKADGIGPSAIAKALKIGRAGAG